MFVDSGIIESMLTVHYNNIITCYTAGYYMHTMIVLKLTIIISFVFKFYLLCFQYATYNIVICIILYIINIICRHLYIILHYIIIFSLFH